MKFIMEHVCALLKFNLSRTYASLGSLFYSVYPLHSKYKYDYTIILAESRYFKP